MLEQVDTAREESAKFAYVCGCDGAHSAVRKILGIPFEGAKYEEHFILADIHLKWKYPHDEMVAVAASDYLLFSIGLPNAPDYYRVIVDELEPTQEAPKEACTKGG